MKKQPALWKMKYRLLFGLDLQEMGIMPTGLIPHPHKYRMYQIYHRKQSTDRL